MENAAAPFTLRETAGAARAALWAALFAAGAYASVPLGPVPVTLQTFFILLCGFTEGPRAWKAAALYVGAGLAGLPVFAGGVSGPAVLLGPTAGFALSFPLSACVAGLAARGRRSLPKYALFGALSTILTNSAGALGLHVNLSLPWARAFLAVAPFLPGGAVKIAAAALCAAPVGRRLGAGRGEAAAAAAGPGEPPDPPEAGPAAGGPDAG
ncbi:MAG: biotin transporter BioY [Deltaproteobacteria bacterium]|jgi:biotin transport system substrate-specific component|nr:biotin transporter BioY [Deltaproteobacteria bacterium]